MTSMELLEGLINVKGKYVLEAHEELLESRQQNTPAERNRVRRKPLKRMALVVLAAVMMLMLMGCAFGLIKLFQMKLGDYPYREPNVNGETEGKVSTGQFISLQGLTGSAEYLATKEWQDFLRDYDRDGTIIQSIGNEPTDVSAKYALYTVYTEEMAEKLEEIISKYDLKLHSEMNVVSQQELDRCVGGTFVGDALSRGWAYIYEDGTFQFDGDINLGGTNYLLQFRRAVKGTFEEVVLNVGKVDAYEEYSYSTPDKNTVLLELGPAKGLVVGDFEDCVITVNLLAGTEDGITIDDLKKLADEIDFNLLKKVVAPELRGDSVIGSDDTVIIDSPEQDTPQEQSRIPAESADGEHSTEPGRLSAYRKVLENIYYHQTFPDSLDCGYDGSDITLNKFAVLDIDGDGNEELLVIYTTTYMAGMAQLIYDYDEKSDSVREEFLEFPSVTFYENGVIVADWSHNQGLAGDSFWPYTLYQYNQEADSYEQVAMVDAWDKSFSEVGYQGQVFPDAVDPNGDGVVYYIMPGTEYQPGTPVDLEDYENWRASLLGNAEKVTVSYQNLTEENINNVK
ncbi:MAG: hypothetical protein ACI4FY_10515 [Acetatifactor sp.]